MCQRAPPAPAGDVAMVSCEPEVAARCNMIVEALVARGWNHEEWPLSRSTQEPYAQRMAAFRGYRDRSQVKKEVAAIRLLDPLTNASSEEATSDGLDGLSAIMNEWEISPGSELRRRVTTSFLVGKFASQYFVPFLAIVSNNTTTGPITSQLTQSNQLLVQSTPSVPTSQLVPEPQFLLVLQRLPMLQDDSLLQLPDTATTVNEMTDAQDSYEAVPEEKVEEDVDKIGVGKEEYSGIGYVVENPESLPLDLGSFELTENTESAAFQHHATRIEEQVAPEIQMEDTVTSVGIPNENTPPLQTAPEILMLDAQEPPKEPSKQMLKTISFKRWMRGSQSSGFNSTLFSLPSNTNDEIPAVVHTTVQPASEPANAVSMSSAQRVSTKTSPHNVATLGGSSEASQQYQDGSQSSSTSSAASIGSPQSKADSPTSSAPTSDSGDPAGPKTHIDLEREPLFVPDCYVEITDRVGFLNRLFVAFDQLNGTMWRNSAYKKSALSTTEMNKCAQMHEKKCASHGEVIENPILYGDIEEEIWEELGLKEKSPLDWRNFCDAFREAESSEKTKRASPTVVSTPSAPPFVSQDFSDPSPAFIPRQLSASSSSPITSPLQPNYYPNQPDLGSLLRGLTVPSQPIAAPAPPSPAVQPSEIASLLQSLVLPNSTTASQAPQPVSPSAGVSGVQFLAMLNNTLATTSAESASLSASSSTAPLDPAGVAPAQWAPTPIVSAPPPAITTSQTAVSMTSNQNPIPSPTKLAQMLSSINSSAAMASSSAGLAQGQLAHIPAITAPSTGPTPSQSAAPSTSIQPEVFTGRKRRSDSGTYQSKRIKRDEGGFGARCDSGHDTSGV